MSIIPESSALDKAIHILRSGGVVAHPTETCYGLACDLKNPAAVKKLFDIKKRPAPQRVSALFSDLAQVEQYLLVTPQAKRILMKYLPGPLTVILPVKPGAPHLYLTAAFSGSDGTVGVRISSHSFAADLVQAFGSPIATTSANLHGRENPYSVTDIQSQLQDLVVPDLVVDGGALPETPPSTVVALSQEGMKILRQGDITIPPDF